MSYELDVFNDPDVILAQTQAAVSSDPLLVNVLGGAVTSVGGALGPTVNVSGSASSGFTVSASGAANTLTISVTVSNAANARTTLGIDAIATKKSNLSAAVAPTVNDDAGSGYAIGSFWIDTALDDGYWCMDATIGAAVWKKIPP